MWLRRQNNELQSTWACPLPFFVLLWPWSSLISGQMTPFPENICSLSVSLSFRLPFAPELPCYRNDFLEFPGLWTPCAGLWSPIQTSSQWAIWLVRHWWFNPLTSSLDTIAEGLCVYNILKVCEWLRFTLILTAQNQYFINVDIRKGHYECQAGCPSQLIMSYQWCLRNIPASAFLHSSPQWHWKILTKHEPGTTWYLSARNESGPQPIPYTKSNTNRSNALI